MQVEIVVLSGQQRRRTFQFHQDEIVVGDQRGDDVEFHPASAPGIRGRRLRFFKTLEGWFVDCLGAEAVWVDDVKVTSRSAIRSGAVIRLSNDGPDLLFKLKKGAGESPADIGSPHGPSPAPHAARTWFTIPRLISAGIATATCLTLIYLLWPEQHNQPPLLVVQGNLHAEVGGRVSLELIVHPRPPHQQATFQFLGDAPRGANLDRKTGRIDWTPGEDLAPGDYPFAVGLFDGSSNPLAECMFAVVLSRPNTPPRFESGPSTTVHFNVKDGVDVTIAATDPDVPMQNLAYELLSGAPPGVRLDAQTGRLTWSPADKPGVDSHQVHVRVTDDGSPPLSDTISIHLVAEREEPWPAMTLSVLPSIYLLTAEDPNSNAQFPYGTATEVATGQLLTTASLATELALRARAGWQINAVSKDGEAWPLVELHVLSAYERLQGTPTEQIYFDLAMLRIERKNGSAAKISSLVAEPGSAPKEPYLCLGFPHSGTPISRLERPEVQPFRLHWLGATSLDPADVKDSPQLVHVQLLPYSDSVEDSSIGATNLYGSPIFNAQGEVVAVYAEVSESPSDKGASQTSVHYCVPCVLAQALLNQIGTELWKPLPIADN